MRLQIYAPNIRIYVRNMRQCGLMCIGKYWRMASPGENLNSRSFIFLEVIEDSGEVKVDEKERAERRVGEEVDNVGLKEEVLVERTAEPPVGSLTCWARYAVCLTR